MIEKMELCPHGKEWPSQGGYDMQICHCSGERRPYQPTLEDRLIRVMNKEHWKYGVQFGRAQMEAVAKAVIDAFPSLAADVGKGAG